MSIAKRVQVCIDVMRGLHIIIERIVHSNGQHLRVPGTFTIAPGKILSSPLSWLKHI